MPCCIFAHLYILLILSSLYSEHISPTILLLNIYHFQCLTQGSPPLWSLFWTSPSPPQCKWPYFPIGLLLNVYENICNSFCLFVCFPLICWHVSFLFLEYRHPGADTLSSSTFILKVLLIVCPLETQLHRTNERMNEQIKDRRKNITIQDTLEGIFF